jgi:hypothetical protein
MVGVRVLEGHDCEAHDVGLVLTFARHETATLAPSQIHNNAPHRLRTKRVRIMGHGLLISDICIIVEYRGRHSRAPRTISG